MSFFFKSFLPLMGGKFLPLIDCFSSPSPGSAFLEIFKMLFFIFATCLAVAYRFCNESFRGVISCKNREERHVLNYFEPRTICFHEIHKLLICAFTPASAKLVTFTSWSRIYK